jgi:hypothetical protein
MSFILSNPNPKGKNVGDCVVRAISICMDRSWEDIYTDLCFQGLLDCDVPSSNAVWGSFLKKNGYRSSVIPNDCPDCYTIEQFCAEHPEGRYILATGNHVVCVINGNYYDAWDSGKEIPAYLWRKEI